ncbi:MAG: FliM/FliN family flagellar motor switch protein [Pyrinomonadaceae bacterium]|nr:FliM/FliN family flagellar motor switch protein [Phycisphaerales bacterium]
MRSDVDAILRLEVPIVVVLAERLMKVSEITSLLPGSIIELAKSAEEELELLVNNKLIGAGSAVKVGENFGIRITYIGDLKDRITALGHAPVEDQPPDDADMDALAAAMLAGQ